MTQNLRSSIKGALNSSIKGGFRAPSFRGSTLDLDFAGAKSLKNQIGKEDVVSFTRASSGTYVGSDGLIQTATTDTPRFDHDPATGESLGLLIEEARTNLLPYSEEFDQWAIGASTTVTTNATTAPDGTLTADRVFNPATGSTFVGIGSVTAGTTYTVSVYAKAVTPGTNNTFTFNVGGTAANASSQFTATAEWQRFTFTITPSAVSPAPDNYLYINNEGDGFASDIYVWGAQLEQGSFPTSYISTDASAVTRAADVAEIIGADFAKTNLQPYSNNFTGAEWTFDGNGTAYATFSADTSPSGENDAWTLTTDAGAYITAPAFTANNIGFGNLKATFDLTNQTVTTQANVISASITALSNGWFRCFYQPTLNFDHVTSVHVKPESGDTFSIEHYVDANRLSTEGSGTVLIYGIQVEEGSVLTDYTPSVESFVSRASSATYVDDTTGLIKTTPVNLLTYSEEFDNAAWFKVNSTITPNSTTAPDGNLTADTFTINSGSTFGRVDRRTLGLSLGVYTFSYYIKDTANQGTHSVEFLDSSNNTFVSVPSGIVGQPNSEWRRIDITLDCAAEGLADLETIRVIFRPSPSPADGTNTVNLWGAQLEEGTTATPYIKTTSTISGAARYENGELLLEEARTNLFTNSLFDDWTAGNIVKKSTNNSAPDGTNTAVLIGDASGGSTNSFLRKTLNVVDGNLKTYTFYAKGTTTGQAAILDYIDGGTTRGAGTINLDDGSVTYLVQTGDAVISSSNAGNGWWRCQLTLTPNGTGTYSWRAGNYDTGDIYVWGAQLEDGSFPTSYIPTEASTVTRAADVSTSALGVDSFYNQSEGTVFVEGATFSDATGKNIALVGFDDGTIAERWRVGQAGNSNAALVVVDSSVVQTNINTPANSAPYNQFHKLAGAIAENNSALGYNGALIPDNSVTVPVVNTLNLGASLALADPLNGHIKRLAYFNTRLPDATLQNITS